MKGAPARANQELAGQADLTTTQRYIDLSPAATDEVIRLLDSRLARPQGGEGNWQQDGNAPVEIRNC